MNEEADEGADNSTSEHTTTDAKSVENLRRRVRSDRHASSIPLVVVGAVGFYYASSALSPELPIVFGLPLAFIGIWWLQRHTALSQGVGAGGDEPLMVAFAVFLGISYLSSANYLPSLSTEPGFGATSVRGVLLVPLALGLAALGQRQRNRPLLGWGLALAVTSVLADVLAGSSLDLRSTVIPYQQLIPQVAFLAAAVFGFAKYRQELAQRSRTGSPSATPASP